MFRFFHENEAIVVEFECCCFLEGKQQRKRREELFLVYFYLFVSCLGCFIAMDLFPQGLSSKVAEKKSSLGRECACFGCGSTFYNKDGSASGIHFFRFPAKNPRKQRWCNLIKRHDGKDDFKVTTSTFLCHFHFKEEDIKKTINMWRLRPDVDPSLNLYVGSSSSKSSSKRRGPRPRFTPQKSCRKKLNLNDADDDINMSGIKELFDDADNTSTCSIETQTDFSFVHTPYYFPSEEEILLCRDHSYGVTMLSNNELANVSLSFSYLSEKIDLQLKEINELKSQVQELKQNINELKDTKISLEKIKNDDTAIKFYTGFPNFSSLLAVFEYIEPKFKHVHYWQGSKSNQKQDLSYQTSKRSKPGPKRKLTTLDEFFLVLMRLKVGLFLDDLSDRFQISTGQVSKIFTTWVNFLYHELPLLFPFPSQCLVRKLMPKQFSPYPTTRIIIDCTEIFIETPSSLKSQSQSWSQYKHHNTWKALVGISPNGVLTFVSKLWSGRVTDKKITSESGILNLLERGDNIMADRGFDIKDVLPPGVSLNIPPFKGARDQLTAEETEETVRIAAVRIHVERAIGRVKNYHILDGVLPLSLSAVADQIFTVCCYLTNFLPPLVPPANQQK